MPLVPPDQPRITIAPESSHLSVTVNRVTSLPYLAGIEVERLRDVGPKSRDALEAMGITTILDLVTHYPRRYIDQTNQRAIADLADSDEALVLATSTVAPADVPGRAGRSSRSICSTGRATCGPSSSTSPGGRSS
jgi:hypothetical protein